MKYIIYVDNDPLNLDLYKKELEKQEFCVTCIQDPDALLPHLKDRQMKPDVVLLDMFFGPNDTEQRGLELLEKVKGFKKDLPVILFTGQMASARYSQEEVNSVVERHPFTAVFPRDDDLSIDVLVEKINKIKEYDQDPTGAERYADWTDRFEFVIGDTPEMIAAAEAIERAAQSGQNVLITGETGTGKEVVANTLHKIGVRCNGPFVVENTAAIPEKLMESEFFGMLKIAGVGIDKDKPGLLESADGGTLFLDEIGEMLPNLQAKLLRFLESGEYRPVGAVKRRTADVRIIAATSQNLEQLIAEKRFRNDLYQRLAGEEIWLPPLRSRTASDFERLFTFFLAKHEPFKISRVLQRELLDWFVAQPWDGNIRRFKAKIDRAVNKTRESYLQIDDFRDDETNKKQNYGNYKNLLGQVAKGVYSWQEIEGKMVPINDMRKFLVDLILLLTQLNGKRPTGKELAALFSISEGNMRQKFKKPKKGKDGYDIELLKFPKL